MSDEIEVGPESPDDSNSSKKPGGSPPGERPLRRHGAAAEARKRYSRKAGKSGAGRALVWGCVGFFIFTLIFASAAIIEGVLALKRMKLAESREGQGMAIAGIVIGILDIAFLLVQTFVI